jgi:hypothetical protein
MQNQSPTTGGSGGSGKVVVKEKAVSYSVASGRWDMNDVYNYRKNGTWPS